MSDVKTNADMIAAYMPYEGGSSNQDARRAWAAKVSRFARKCYEELVKDLDVPGCLSCRRENLESGDRLAEWLLDRAVDSAVLWPVGTIVKIVYENGSETWGVVESWGWSSGGWCTDIHVRTRTGIKTFDTLTFSGSCIGKAVRVCSGQVVAEKSDIPEDLQEIFKMKLREECPLNKEDR